MDTSTCLTALNIHAVALIAPIRSLPTVPDTGMGNLYAAQDFLRFVRAQGFTHVQLDPSGATTAFDISPYTGSAFSESPLQIDPSMLESIEWGELLPTGTVASAATTQSDTVQYEHVSQLYAQWFAQAYDAFCQKRQAGQLTELNQRFEAFKTQNHHWLERDALYEALSQHYGVDDFRQWPKNAEKKAQNKAEIALDQSLCVNAHEPAKHARKQALLAQYHTIIDRYQFIQFLAATQREAVKTLCQSIGLGLIADRQVGLANRDIWAFQDVFLPGWSLGCPPDYFSADGQTWNFPVFHPHSIFHALGPDQGCVNFEAKGTQLLQALYRKIFADNPGGVRIDHTVGLIDPWVYPANASSTKDGARLYSSPNHPELKQFSRIGPEHLTPGAMPDSETWILPEAMADEAVFARYASIVQSLILPEADRAGVPRHCVIFEDLGTLTTPVATIMERCELSGIRVTQFAQSEVHRPKYCRSPYWVMLGSHDNPPIWQWIEGLTPQERQAEAERLAEELYQQPDSDELVAALTNDHVLMIQAMSAELFAHSPQHVQVFFADWLGLTHMYNRPATFDSLHNWRLRIPAQYQQVYAQACQQRRSFDLARLLPLALDCSNACC